MLDDAKQLRDKLNTAGVPATTDPAWAATNRPCVLIPPPTIDYTTRSLTWQLAALTAQASGTEAAWVELAELVEQVNDQLPVETAAPASYALTPETGTVPAYLLRVTTSY